MLTQVQEIAEDGYSLAQVIHGARGSTIRKLLKLNAHKDTISFAGGLPAPELFDVEGLNQATQSVLEHDWKYALQYGTTEGVPRLRSALAALMHQRGAIHVQADDLLITSGAQQGIDLVSHMMIDPGDGVIVERPTYLAALQNFRMHEATLLSVEGDAQGMDPDAVEHILSREQAKLLYVVPNFANPSGAILSLERRMRILELAVKYQIVVVEDDPYGELYFDERTPPPLFTLADRVPGARARVIYLSSLSKIVAPGLRVAWAIPPKGLLTKLTIVKESADLQSSTFTQAIAARYLESGRLEAHMRQLRHAYGERAMTFSTALKHHLPGIIEFNSPKGGMFIWGRLTHGLDAHTALERAIQQHVTFVPGSDFYPNQPRQDMLRLSFATATPSRIEEGISRLTQALLSEQ